MNDQLTEELIQSYIAAKAKLAECKKLEAELRIKVLEIAFPDSTVGTYNTFSNDYKIKGVFKNNITINTEKMNETYDSLSPAEKMCVNFKPSLKLSVYNELEPEEKELLDDCITIKPAMPTLTIELDEE